VNASQLRAVGWVFTRDVFVDSVRAAFGAPRRIEPKTVAAMAQHWCAVEQATRAERVSSIATFASGAAALSARSAEALTVFVERIVAECPARYAPAALRQRCRLGVAQAASGFVGGLLLSSASAAPDSLAAESAFVLFAMGLWSSMTTLQLWQIYRLVKELATRGFQSSR
jgi:hypothetical protein